MAVALAMARPTCGRSGPDVLHAAHGLHQLLQVSQLSENTLCGHAHRAFRGGSLTLFACLILKFPESPVPEGLLLPATAANRRSRRQNHPGHRPVASSGQGERLDPWRQTRLSNMKGSFKLGERLACCKICHRGIAAPRPQVGSLKSL